MIFDLERARRDTPGCRSVTHFNNAGAALLPQPVLDAFTGHLGLEAEIGGYEAQARNATAIEDTYDAVATLLHCDREEVALVDCATRAWDMAFYAVPFQPGDRVLTAVSEYESNYIAYLQRARRDGIVVEPIPNDDTGALDVDALRGMMDERVKMISISYIPTNGGLVNPATEVGRVAREWDALYLLDACQAVGQMPVDVRALGCDFLSATGRKYLRGPRGTGLLYARRAIWDAVDPPFLDTHAARWTAPDQYELRNDARRFETWEADYAARIGLGVAARYASAWGLESIRDRIVPLAQRLRDELNDLPGVTVRDLGRVQCGIVTFDVAGIDPYEVKRRLAAEQINVAVSPDHFTLLDMRQRELTALVRASVHYYNDGGEFERLVGVVDRIRSGQLGGTD